ncbi:MAG TPA: tetratricopeptide repeat protein [Gemmatimonadaceae bacterium]|nr:tetratricopeptide repeat protein [Gemmatimonadaceae bacterium]
MAANSALIEELIQQYAQNPRRVFARLANEYRKAGKLDDAILICRSNVPLQPTYISGYIVLGQALYDYGQFDEARETFEAALNLDPENLIALRHLGDIARSGGDLDSARSWYHRLLEVDPQNDEVALQLSQLEAAAAPRAPEPESGAPISWSDINPERQASPPMAPPQGVPGVSLGSSLDFGDDAQQTLAQALGMDAPAATPMEETQIAGLTRGFGLVEFSDPPPPPAVPEPEAPPAPIEREASTWTYDVQSEPVAAEWSAPSVEPEPATAGAEIERAPELSMDHPTAEPMAAEASDVRSFAEPVPAFEPEPDLPPALEPPSVEPPRVTAHAPPIEPVTYGRPEEEEEPPLSLGEVEPSFTRQDERGRVDSWSSVEMPSAEQHPAAGEPEEREQRWDIEEPYDPTVGRMLDLPRATPSEATPAAFVTETMAELYLQQGFHEEALSIYRQLSAQRPDDEALKERIARLEGGAKSSISVAASISEDVINAARERVVRPGRTIRSFFASFFGRRPPLEGEMTATAGEGAVPGGGAEAPRQAAVEATPSPVETARPSFAEFLGVDAFATPSETSTAASASAAAAWEPEVGAAATPAAPSFEDDPIARALGGWEPRPPVAPATPAPEAPPMRSIEEFAYDADVEIVEPVRRPTPVATPAVPIEPPVARPMPPRPSGVGFTELFAGSTISQANEEAASTLAGAFSEEFAPEATEIAGQPTRAASDSLTLDDVFRDTRAKAEPKKTGPSVSFDEFFAKRDAPGNGEPRTEGTPSPTDTAGASPADLALFHEWLDGLKK